MFRPFLVPRARRIGTCVLLLCAVLFAKEANAASALHLSGTVTYSKDTFFDVTALKIDPGTNIVVTNGATLVIIAANTDIGDGVSLTARGTDGGGGGNGGPPPGDNPWTSSGKSDGQAHSHWQAAVDANKNGTNGGIDRGRPGGNGTAGSSGGNFRLYLTTTVGTTAAFATLYAKGGVGGVGGSGGPGRVLKCGGHGSHVWQASSGAPGSKGSDGADGRIELYLTGPAAGDVLTSANNSASPPLAIGKSLTAPDWNAAVEAERAKPH